MRLRQDRSGSKTLAACVLLALSACVGDDLPSESRGATAQEVTGNNLAGNNLAGVNLAGNNLAGNNLAGVNLGGANLAGNNLAGNNLAGTNLAGNNLAGNNLAGNNLAGSNLAGNNLAGNNLAGNNLAGSNLAGSGVAGAFPGQGCPKAGTSNLGTDLTLATVATDIHGSVTNQMLYSGEDLYNRPRACVVAGFGSTALARLISQNTASVTMFAAIRQLSWGFTTSAGGATELATWEVVVWGATSYSVFVLAAPPSATHAGVAGFVKAIWRWSAPPTRTLQIGAIGGGQPVVSYPGMMDAGSKLVAGAMTEKAYVAGELALVTATTNNVSVTVDFSSWVRGSTGAGVMLGNVTTPSGPSHGEAAYVALEEPDGTVRIAIRSLSAASIVDSMQELGAAFATWQRVGGTKPAPRRCAGALFLSSLSSTETDWQSKCDSGVTWAPQTAQTTGHTTWAALGGAVSPYNSYMTIQGPAATPYVTCRPTDIVAGSCPTTSLLPVISETFVHMWEPAYTGEALGTAAQLALGGNDVSYFGCAVRSDTTLWCWGSNENGQLGNASLGLRPAPSPSLAVTALGTGVAQVATGGSHACARKTDGTLWCWGGGGSGQLGDGGSTSRTSPVQVKVNATTLLTGVTAVAASWGASCAITSDGALWCWGDNGNGQLGLGSYAAQPYATRVGTATWAQLAISMTHTCGIQTTGTLWCWGGNASGQLGIGNLNAPNRPFQVGTLAGWAQVATGTYHSCARKTDSSLWCWGANWSGQHGIGSAGQTILSPAQTVALGTTVASLTAGNQHTCVRKTDGTVWCMGGNDYGQLGDGTTTGRNNPTLVPLYGAQAVELASSRHNSCARLLDGSIRCWGANGSGQLASGVWAYRSPAQQVAALGAGVAQVAVYRDYACARKTDRTLWCWGNGLEGRLGNLAGSDSSIPVQVKINGNTVLGNVIDVALAWNHACATTGDGKLWCWGAGNFAQLGDGTSNARSAATQVTALGTGVARAAPGYFHTCARKTDGTVACWGANWAGELGDSTTTQRSNPVAVSGLSGVVELVVGHEHACARKSDGTLWCWGLGTSGELGTNNNATSYVPVQVTALGASVAAVATGPYHVCARKLDGTAWCWGANTYGQLGDGTTIHRKSPVQVTVAGGDLVDLLPGREHTCARKADGSLWCWGLNLYGQLGNGTTSTSSYVATRAAVSVAQASAGEYNTCAVKTDGTLWCWGLSSFGQIGNATTPHSTTPKTALTW